VFYSGGIAATVRRAEQIRESQGAAAVKRLAPPRRWPNGTTSRGPFQDERMMLLPMCFPTAISGKPEVGRSALKTLAIAQGLYIVDALKKEQKLG